ncbi:MAG: c-type cytochrome [Gemmataceae bacterium]|nr:c-type cytochrome [Gemmataceae bacterium]
MRPLLATTAGLGLALLLLPTPAHPQPKKDPYSAHIASTPARTPAEERKAFRLPPGFEAQLVASEPDIRMPINIAFDARGQLWVTQSTEYPFPAKPDTAPRDTVKILSDFGADGRAGKITTFADGLNIPIGVLPLSDGALVYSIPNIYRLKDTMGKGRADQREALYGTYGFQDTHGMTGEFMWGFDGWVYVCHGFANTSAVKAKDGSAIKMQSGNTYRIKPDGSRIEQWTWGQVNPFGLTFDPLGNLYSADCHSQPIYQLLRGAYYPSFGKPHDGLGFGPEMVRGYKGSTAIAGIAFYAADHFPKAHRETAFIGDVVVNRVNQFRLEWSGSTPRAIQQDFLVSSDPWFRPVDVKLGPDGALYIADFYTRIIGHYEVPLTHPLRTNQYGRIWRIVYTGDRQKLTAPPDLTRASVDELIRQLGSDNLTVRTLAANQLAAGGGAASDDALRRLASGSGSLHQRVHALWVLERRGALPDNLLAGAAGTQDVGARTHAMRILAERKELPAPLHKLAVAGLKDASAHVQRAAAEALGRHPRAENLRPLLDLRRTVPAGDTHLLHMVRMSLRDQLRPASTWKHLETVKLSEQDARALADVCTGVASPEAAHFLLAHIQRYPEGRGNLPRYVHHIARHATAKGFDEQLVQHIRKAHADDLGLQAALYRAVHNGTQERGAAPGTSAVTWANDLAGRLLKSGREGEVLAGIEVAGLLRNESMFDHVAALALGKAPESQRKAALVALAAIQPERAVGPLVRVLSDMGAPLPLREQAASSLAATNRPEAHAELLKILAQAPARLETGIAVALASSWPGAEKLLEAVAAGKASARLLQERPIEARLRQAKLPKLDQRLAALTRGVPPLDQGLRKLLEQRRAAFTSGKTDVALGAKLFEKHCASCHQVSAKGSKIGPQLDGIGVRGLERLLEDILDPNRNIDQAFRATAITTTAGQQVLGLLLREEGAVLVLADLQGKEVRIRGSEVERKAVVPLSPMPSNLGEQIPEPELSHLLAYLLAQRPPEAVPGKRPEKRR